MFAGLLNTQLDTLLDAQLDTRGLFRVPSLLLAATTVHR